MSLVWLLVLRATRRTPYQWRAYNAYLRSSTWKRRSAAVLYAAEHRCDYCGVEYATQVHHETYRLVGWEPQRHLRAVCRTCHQRSHGRSF